MATWRKKKKRGDIQPKVPSANLGKRPLAIEVVPKRGNEWSPEREKREGGNLGVGGGVTQENVYCGREPSNKPRIRKGGGNKQEGEGNI